MRRNLPAIIVLAFIIAGCGAATTGSSSGSVGPAQTAAASSEPTSPPSAASTPSTAAGTDDCDTTNVTILHQAPAFEAILPASVADRPMAKWSVSGRCWLKVVTGLPPSELDGLLAELQTAEDPRPVDVSSLTYAVAGRSDTTGDPPYFTFVTARAATDKEIQLALFLLFGGAAFRDPATAGDLSAYEERTIAGKQVYVGTTEMLAQNEHQRGRPYLYQNDDYMFLVIADDDAWVADAIGQLP